jgi:hypothetical protein
MWIREIFVGKSEKSEVEKLSGRSRNMRKCITMNVVCARVVWNHVAWELGTAEWSFQAACTDKERVESLTGYWFRTKESARWTYIVTFSQIVPLRNAF